MAGIVIEELSGCTLVRRARRGESEWRDEDPAPFVAAPLPLDFELVGPHWMYGRNVGLPSWRRQFASNEEAARRWWAGEIAARRAKKMGGLARVAGVGGCLRLHPTSHGEYDCGPVVYGRYWRGRVDISCIDPDTGAMEEWVVTHRGVYLAWGGAAGGAATRHRIHIDLGTA